MKKSDVGLIIQQLEQLKTAFPETDNANIAGQWINAIREKQKFLDDRRHQVVFIGEVGVGKSSLIGVLANLLVGGKPTDKKSLKDNSVLSIGAGRTTICEVHIRSPQEEETGQLGLIIEPVSNDEMQEKIAFYAETEWYRYHQPDMIYAGDDGTEPTPEEIQRAIRNMTDYAEHQEIFFESEQKRRRTVRPLDEAVSRFDSYETLSSHLIERAQLDKRTETKWWWNDCNSENLQALKNLFEEINEGKRETAMLPKCINVVIPRSYFSIGDNMIGPVSYEDISDLQLILIDTRGLDGPAESRDDLYNYLKDQRSVIVFCSPFKDAPGKNLRDLLIDMKADAELRNAIHRTILVLVDQDDASQVNGADGDRNFGQDLKIGECLRVLESSGLPVEIKRDRITAFDTLQDDRDYLMVDIYRCLKNLRNTEEDQLDTWRTDAKKFLEGVTNEIRPNLCNTVDKRIKEIMAQYPLPSEPPLRDPLAGLYATIRSTRYASVIYASCRRSGEYENLNLYAAVRAKASQEATHWLDTLINKIIEKLDELQKDDSLILVQDYISLRKMQYQEARIEVIRDYADQVKKETYKSMRNNPVWNKCSEEWGHGKGFIGRVIKHLEEWGNRQQEITAHEKTNARNVVPLLEEVSLAPQSPQFGLHVRNLRALRHVAWNPSQLSVLIGANGAGKTTLLLVLKLLRVAYERGLPEAVTQVLGGSRNLRSWGMNQAEAIEIGIDVDTASWRIQLVPHEGTVDYHANEYLSDREQEIFSRDALGPFSYGGDIIEPSSKLGLRILMDRGVNEPALRKVASFFQCISVYHDPDLWNLRQGSNTYEDRILQSRGGNALTLLRRWHQERVNQHRYRFVVEGLAVAFPNIISELDFVEAGNTLVARTYPPGRDIPVQLSSEANGVLQLLVLLCNVANAEDGDLIAIDEPENSLHPYAIRSFLRRTKQWAIQHKLTVLLATHSTVILDALTGSPEQVYVMKADEPEKTLPTRLDELCNREWMEGFKLGDLYEQGEIGSNEDEV